MRLVTGLAQSGNVALESDVGVASNRCRAMIPDLDIGRAAQVMVKHFGDGAAIEFAMRVDEFLDQGNFDGQRVWMRIMQAIEELQRERSGDGEAVH